MGKQFLSINTHKLLWAIGSTQAFLGILAVFIIETGYLSITSRFPMAFDEAYHFGLIRFFSHRLDPIVTTQPSNSYQYGALVQGSSLFYHYLMSFPYRLLELFTTSYTTQVIYLRLINVCLAVITILIIKKLLQLLNISRALSNVIIAALAFTPVFMLLSAQINYDNLLITLSTLCIYETVLFTKELGKKILNLRRLIVIVCLCLITSLVMYSFFPIFLSIIIFIALALIKIHNRMPNFLAKSFKPSFSSIPKLQALILLLASVVSIFLFARIYIVNVIKYHDPLPECNQILNIKDCEQYYAWEDDYLAKQQNKLHPNLTNTSALDFIENTVSFTSLWAKTNLAGLYGTIFPQYGIYSLNSAYLTFIFILAGGGLICLILNLKTILKQNKSLLIFLIVCAIYILFLWARNYHDFLQFGAITAVSGRYLVPILVYFYSLLAVAVSYEINKKRKYKLNIKLGLAIFLIAGFIGLGGFWQYNSKITPVYGHLSSSNNFSIYWSNQFLPHS